MGDKRIRHFFITINGGASCFKNAVEITKEANAKHYAIILHDKDFDEVTGQEIAPHFHAFVVFEHAKTFQAVAKHFEGAHIEASKSPSSSARYLLHASFKGKGKASYAISELITDNAQWYEGVSKELEAFDTNRIEEYYAEGCKDILAYYRRFGDGIERHIHLIRTIITELKLEDYSTPPNDMGEQKFPI